MSDEDVFTDRARMLVQHVQHRVYNMPSVVAAAAAAAVRFNSCRNDLNAYVRSTKCMRVRVNTYVCM
jgi:hypothetical protein